MGSPDHPAGNLRLSSGEGDLGLGAVSGGGLVGTGAFWGGLGLGGLRGGTLEQTHQVEDGPGEVDAWLG